jgi:hypothetical protein
VPRRRDCLALNSNIYSKYVFIVGVFDGFPARLPKRKRASLDRSWRFLRAPAGRKKKTISTDRAPSALALLNTLPFEHRRASKPIY